MMTRSYLLPIALAAFCAILAAIWWLLPGEWSTDQGGTVRIAASAAPPSPVAKPAAAPAMPERVAIVATQPQVDLSDRQSYRIGREQRDAGWAARSEAAIGEQLQSIAYIGGKRRLAIKCAASLCEVTGIADPDPATHSYAPVWEALERDTAGDALARFGLQRVAAIFDTGRIPEEFKIQYRRLDPIPATECSEERAGCE